MMCTSLKRAAHSGRRLDWFDTFGLFASPRLGVRFEPSDGQTIRVTYNRAYVAPSTVESYANFASSIGIPLGAAAFPVPITTVGNQDLASADDRRVRGWIQRTDRQPRDRQRVGVSPAVEGRHQPDDRGAVFVERSPPGWPLPAAVLDGLSLPKLFQWDSVGNLSESGFETGVDCRWRGDFQVPRITPSSRVPR